MISHQISGVHQIEPTQNHIFWPDWTRRLHQLGLHSVAALLLESAGPLTGLLAQMVYLGQPFLPGGQTSALAHLLENPPEARAFAAFLREENEL